jgi:hypothetical protein
VSTVIYEKRLAMMRMVKPGDIFGKFRVLRQLDDGWLAERTEDFAQYGVLMVLPALATTVDEVTFLERRQKISQLSDPAIPKLIASTESLDGLLVNVFDFAEAETALDVADRERWSLKRRLDFSLQCLDALTVVHRSLLAYGTLSDSSFRLSTSRGARLAILPLVVRQEDPVMADLTATASFLESLWSRCRPLPQDLRSILRKAHGIEASCRYSSVEEIANDVRAFSAHRPVSTRASTPLYRLQCIALRQPALFAMVGLLAIAALAATAQSVVKDAASKRSRDQARLRLHQLQELTSATELNLYQPVHVLPNSSKATVSLIQWTSQSLDSVAAGAGSDHEIRSELAQGYLRLAEMQRSDGDAGGAITSVSKSRAISVEPIR